MADCDDPPPTAHRSKLKPRRFAATRAAPRRTSRKVPWPKRAV